VTKKLAGAAAGTAAWATNVGNEHGQVLVSVLTAAEGAGLADMAAGLVNRYLQAGQAPPVILYVDRDCCGAATKRLFQPWRDLHVRLDIWHFMRRFVSCCTTESHQLYGLFMSKLSACIFQWDSDDITALRRAKSAELVQMGVSGLSEADVLGRLSRKELALHCRRTTRGVESTTTLLQQLIDCFDSDQGTDSMGVPLLDHDRIQQMWKQQRQHIACIQDPADVSLYTKTGSLVKGGVELPTYRCARGSTSLESFHSHVAKFIPGQLIHTHTCSTICCYLCWEVMFYKPFVSLFVCLSVGNHK